MRLFVAIDLSEAQRATAARAGEELQRALDAVRAPRAVRWAPSSQLHVTLRFIGEVDEAAGARIMQSLAPSLLVPPFPIALGAAGMFPGPSRPRVIWIGLSDGAAGAAACHEAVEERLGALGIPAEERAFRAHLTIGRVREIRPREASALAGAMRLLSIDPAPATVTDATLYRSHLSPKGARYEPLVRTRLSG